MHFRSFSKMAILFPSSFFEEQCMSGKNIGKNWIAICNLGRKNRLLMMVLACLEIKNLDDVTKKLIAAFPECFSEDGQKGPYPLSYIRELAEKDHYHPDPDRPFSSEVHAKLNIPCILLAYGKEELDEYPEWLNPRPENISLDVKQGDIVEYNGTKMMVFENNDGTREIALVPAELIDIGL